MFLGGLPGRVSVKWNFLKKEKEWKKKILSVILLTFELNFRPIQNLPVKIKSVWLEWMATREECKNALTWQSTIKWENVWSFITNTHSLPPMLPCFARGDMKGGIWGRGQGGWGGLSIPLTLLSSPLLWLLDSFTKGQGQLAASTVDLYFSSPLFQQQVCTTQEVKHLFLVQSGSRRM